MIHLINMPFASIREPNLALGVMKSQLTESGIASRVFNLNFDFARLIGIGAYETMALFKGIETQVGEWLFAEQVWEEFCDPSEAAFLRMCGDELGGIPHVNNSEQWLLQVRREVVPTFLREMVAFLQTTGELRVVAFSCMFFQTIPSLALGRLIKAQFPSARIVFGGACFHGEMGEELIDKVPWIDVVSTGEADDIIVPLFQALLNEHPPAGLQGIRYRDHRGKVQAGFPPCPVSAQVIRALPDPDFTDFFESAGRVGLLNDRSWRARVLLPFESSRGCWWGEKQHCTFCGLNGEGMSYRAQPAERVYETLANYAHRYPIRRFRATDNILDMSYFKSLLPRLKAEPPGGGIELYYNIKANMNRVQMKALADAGIVYVQPGIESLSSHLLRLMRKGVLPLQNVFLLKCAREYGIVVFWNNLIRVPGECPEDYAQMEEWIPKLVHLQPPYGGAPKVELHRFSPYFFEQGNWTDNVRPIAWYKGLFPEQRVNLPRIAYYFDADWKDTLGGDAYDGVINATLEWIRIWRDEPELPRLVMKQCVGGGLEIEDTRLHRSGLWQLDSTEASIYQMIDAPHTPQGIISLLKDTPKEGLLKTEVKTILDRFVDADLALWDGSNYLALALPQGVVDLPVAQRRLVSRRITNQRPNR